MHWTTVFENNYQHFIDKGWLRSHDLRVVRGSMDKIYKFITDRTPSNVWPVGKSTIKSGICSLKDSILAKSRGPKLQTVVPEIKPEAQVIPAAVETTQQVITELLNPIASSIESAFNKLKVIIAEKDEQLKTKNNKIIELEAQLIDLMNMNSTITESRTIVADALKNVERLSIEINKTVAHMELNNERAIE